VIDWGQTRTVAKHPELYQETNPIMGKHPSLRTVNTYFSSAIVGSALIAHALPGELRKGFLGGIAVWEIHITQNNLKIGVGCTF